MWSFLKFLSPKQEESIVNQDEPEKTPLFLTTHGLNYYIEKLIQEAEQYICIMSPYLKLCSRLEELLLERKQSGVKIYMICRVDDAKYKIDHIATVLKDRKKLHAKCFLSEHAAIVGSLNLYDFSQIHNDEMGFYCSKDAVPTMYDTIHNEVKRIYNAADTIAGDIADIPVEASVSTLNNPSCEPILEVGTKYSLQDLDVLFNFDYKAPSGIKSGQNGDIFLFMNDTKLYQNKESQGIIYFQGQNTGKGAQKLIFGNKKLHEAYGSSTCRVFLFKTNVYDGEYHVCKEPFTQNDKWIFPISKK